MSVSSRHNDIHLHQGLFLRLVPRATPLFFFFFFYDGFPYDAVVCVLIVLGAVGAGS